MQKVYMAAAELRFDPRYGDTFDHLLYMFEIANYKRGEYAIDEVVEDGAPAREGNPEYDLFVRQAWPKLTHRQRSTLELWMNDYSSSAIEAVLGKSPNTVYQTIETTLERIRAMMKELLKDRYSALDKKTKESSSSSEINLREFEQLQHEFHTEIQLLKQLPSTTKLPEKWDTQLLAEIQDHLALIKIRLSE
jgi:DNA-binding CsgD family transcriptional regulator